MAKKKPVEETHEQIIERLSNLHPNELGKLTLLPHIKDAAFKRMIEKRQGLPKAPKSTVVRDKKTGKAMPATPKTSVVTRTTDPVVKKFKKGELVTVKPRKQKKQTPIAKPVPGQIGKVEGKPVRVTPENLQQVYDEKRTTALPTAGPEEMTPANRPSVEQAIMPKTLRSSQNKKNLGGFARSHKEVSAVTHEALGHLQTMANAEKSSPEFHESHAAFNTLHGQLGQIGNKVLHRDMGLGRTIITQLHGKPGLANALKIHRGVVLGRLEEGKIAEQSRGERAQQGQGGNS